MLIPDGVCGCAVPNSVLFLGRPGVGKTTVIREMARVLADDLRKRVVRTHHLCSMHSAVDSACASFLHRGVRHCCAPTSCTHAAGDCGHLK